MASFVKSTKSHLQPNKVSQALAYQPNYIHPIVNELLHENIVHVRDQGQRDTQAIQELNALFMSTMANDFKVAKLIELLPLVTQ